MTLHTGYLIHCVIGAVGCLAIIAAVIAVAYMEFCKFEDAPTEVIPFPVLAAVSIIALIILTTIGGLKFTSVYHDIYVAKFKAEAIYQEVKEIEYDKILEFIKEVKK